MAKTRNNQNICFYCFGELDSDRVCLACGKKEDDTPSLPHHLPRRTLLKKRYLIDKAIGEGGFGITYSALDLQSEQRVAIKEYYPSGYVSREQRTFSVIINSKQNYALSNRGLKRFIDEAKNLISLKNLSGIVSTTDFFSANNTAYIVMEYLDGVSLKKYLHHKGKLDCSTALTILKPVVFSLVSVHNAGLIHRDVSPDNILITKNNEVKLIDFGASKQSSTDEHSVSIVIKQGFAPEEQYRIHGEQGPWTDVYALGVTIYYCITGQIPPESIQRMYDDTIVTPSTLGASITKKQEDALMKAISVYAKDRYQTVGDFIKDIYDGDDAPVEEKCVVATPDFGDESSPSAYVFPQRDRAIDRKKTASSLRTIIWGERSTDNDVTDDKACDVVVETVATSQNNSADFSDEFQTIVESTDGYEFMPRTTFVERKYSHEDLRRKLDESFNK